MATDPQEYVLGTHDDELARLGLQHGLWRAQALGLMEKAGFAPGQRLLDIGSGPGFTTAELAAIAGPRGSVVATDLSPRFLEHLRTVIAPAAPAPIETVAGDVAHLDLPPGSFDGAYVRWVLCFVPDVAAVVAAVARALRPGGVFAIADYLHYRAMRLAPRSAAFDRVLDVVDASWRGRGGDPDVACRLPEILHGAGFDVRVFEPVIRIARSGSSLWRWPETFFMGQAPRLEAQGLLTAAERAAFEADFRARSADPQAFLVTPTMADIVAVKR